jgi:hypothetical protein
MVQSVSSRNRWRTSQDALDYPPNHLLRWNPDSLSTAFRAHGFSVMSMKQEKPSVVYVAQRINGSLLSVVSRSLAPELPGWFRDEIQESPENKELHNAVGPSFPTRVVQFLGRAKHAACFLAGRWRN